MSANFDFDNTKIFLHFDITRVDGQLADELENYFNKNLVDERRKGDCVYVGLEDRSWSVSVVRYETSIKNANSTYLKELHKDIYQNFHDWVLSMGGIENVAD
jgi:hypothetical protein